MNERPHNAAIGKEHALVHFFALLASTEDLETAMRLLVSGIASFLPVDAVALGFSYGGDAVRIQTWRRGAAPEFQIMAGEHSAKDGVSGAIAKFDCPLRRSMELVYLGKTSGYLAVCRNGPEFSSAEDFLLTSLQTLTSMLLAKHGADEALRESRAALLESEQRVRLKLNSILSPEADIRTLEMADVIDTPALQSLMDDFYALTGMPIGIIDLKGKVLVGVGWQDICTKFHRVNPESCKHCVESDVELSAGIAQGEFRLYHCKNNMWDVATPIVVGGKHVGNLFSGQFFFDGESLDYELFRNQAQKYGFNEARYIDALDRVKRLKRETVATGMACLAKIAQMISQLSYGNVKLAHSLEERKRAAEEVSHRNRTLDGINTIFREALQCETAEDLGRACLRVAEDLTASRFGFIGEIGSDGLLHDLAMSEAGRGCEMTDKSGHRRAPGSFKIHGLYGRVLKYGKSLLTNTPQEHPDSIGTPSGHVRLTAFLGVPLIDGSRTVGVIAMANREGGYRHEDQQTLEALAPAIVEALHRKRTEQALIRSEKLASVGRLAATIAHEINNPLAGATNALYIVSQDKSLSQQARAMADIVDRELRRAAEITRRTLGFYREPNSKVPVVVSELVNDLAALYERRLKDRNIVLHVRCPDHKAAMIANPGEARQLFSNLLSNSIDAVGNGGTVHIHVKPCRHNGSAFVCITVADTGPGIEPHNLRRLYEPFFTTKRDVGSGLGLWICEQIAKRHGGKIRVRSRVGKGTVFAVRLPASAQTTASLAAAAH